MPDVFKTYTSYSSDSNKDVDKINSFNQYATNLKYKMQNCTLDFTPYISCHGSRTFKEDCF